MRLTIHPIPGFPMIEPGDDLAAALFAAMDEAALQPQDGDVLVVCQKVVSKSEGRVVDLRTVTPSAFARQVAAVSDQRDPRIYDSRLNVLAFTSIASGGSIAIMVQWNSHPEVTLGWKPPADAAGLDEACAVKGWEGDNCTAEDRYFSGDYVCVLETRLNAVHGGEVAFFNGALGVLTGPLHA